MLVQTIEFRTLYGGDQEKILCDSCSSALQETIEDNASTNYFSYLYEPKNNWHEGTCQDHEQTQSMLNRRCKWH